MTSSPPRVVASRAPQGRVTLGLRENAGQFGLLVLVNASVGGMVGLERTVVPLVGTEEFQISSAVVVFSFIVAFGVVKAFSNLADRFTRKSVLVAGWAVGLPVPFLLAWGPTWGWIVAANVLLGLSQGLAWSMTVNMKIDLVGPKHRGLAMGLNEFAGYGAVGLTAFVTGYIAARWGLRPEPFYLGIAYTVLGLGLSTWAVRDTRAYAETEAALHVSSSGTRGAPRVSSVVAETSWRNRTLFGVSQAGLVNNLNDGMSWGVFPLLFAAHGVGLEGIGLIKAVYPLTWGIGQLVTGALGPDRPQASDCGRDVGSGGRARGDWARSLPGVSGGNARLCAPRGRYGDGLSRTTRGRRGRSATLLARERGGRLPLLA